MKHIVQKIAGILSAVILGVSCTCPVMAAATDNIDTSAKGSITIHKYDMTVAQEEGVDLSSFVSTGKEDKAAEAQLAQYAISAVEFTYLRVGEIKTHSVTSGNLNFTEVIYGVDEALMSILSLEKADAVTGSDTTYYYTSDQLNSALAEALNDNTVTKNSLEEYILDMGGTHMSLTDETGETYADNLPVGLYLLVETKVPENVFYTTNPFFVSVPSTDANGQDWFYDIEVYPKNQTDEPTINKLVAEEGIGTYADTVSASEGDILDYTVYSHLPKITSTASYLTKYTFVDTACKGLTYDQDSVAINFYETEAEAQEGDPSKAIASWSAGTNFGAAFAGQQSADHTMTITMTAAGLAELNTNTDLAEAYMAVQYQAQVDSSAETTLGDTGNKNDVTLTWARTNTAEEQTITDRSVVFTFGIDLTKTFEGGQGNAAAVQFVLKNSTDNYYITATGSNGVYYVTDSTEGTTAAESQGTVFSPAADGTLKINGLEEDTYILTEIATDAGFSLLKDSITITYTCTVPIIQETLAERTGIGSERPALIYTAGDDSKVLIDNNGYTIADGLAVMQIVNTHTFTLPQTGGNGLWMATICGICLAGFGFFLLFGKRNEDEANA